MVEIPDNPVTQSDLEQWYAIQEQLSKLKKSEMLLRMKIFKGLFPCAEEGTNNHSLGDGYVLKAKVPVNRDVDQAALTVNRERFQQNGINPDSLINWKPSLSVSAYRELTAEQRQMFDECLIIKPGTPSLEIVLPARAKKVGEQAG